MAYPGALSTGAAASEKQRPSGRFFHVTDIRRYLISSGPLEVAGPGRPAVPLPPRARSAVPGPGEAIPKYKQPARGHKGAAALAGIKRANRGGFRSREGATPTCPT